jgi:hypothetical protein
VAAAFDTAIKAQPPAQSGFARPLMLSMLLALAVPVAIVLPGCVTTSPQSQLILEATTRIAVRRALESDRAIEKARNIREVALTLQGLVTAESDDGSGPAAATSEAESGQGSGERVTPLKRMQEAADSRAHRTKSSRSSRLK